jgi:lipoyl synthase
MKTRARRLSLATVCEEAQCPNIGECWGGGTATFMLMGDTCTRGCKFCAVNTQKRPAPLNPGEPAAVAEAVAELGASYIVLTSVNRDELADGGAAHLAECLRAIDRRNPGILLEMLVPDFQGQLDAVDEIVAAPLAVFAHNLETVRRLTPEVRDRRATFDQSLAVLRHAKDRAPHILTKTSLMLGLGETQDEVLEAMSEARAEGVDILTLGQYLRPSTWHLPVQAYIPPEQFDRLADKARSMGYAYVASGPLVRSSYRAGELFVERHIRKAHPHPQRQEALV